MMADDTTSFETYNAYEDMNLKKSVLRGILSYGFEKPSAIQQKAIVPFVQGRDIVAMAQSGTGKTGCFSISVLERMDDQTPTTLQTIILSPTRELAQQTCTIISELGKYTPFKFMLLTGGRSRRETQDELFAIRPTGIVGTPGRINDFLNGGCIQLGNLRCLILDEADEMLSDTFQDQIRNVIHFITETTQIGLYSATMPQSKIDIANKFMNNPLHILVKTEELTLEGIRQYQIQVDRDEWKYETLKDLYGAIVIYQLIIYCNSKKRVDSLHYSLTRDGYMCSYMHSEMHAKERSAIMHKFRVGENRILITTDLLARGIDIQQVSLVVNYDIPNNIENYIHRIGRSGRYGRKGIALNFVSQREAQQLKKIETFYETEIKELPNDIEAAFTL